MAREWQWSAEIPGDVSPETGTAPRAFLWIPSSCERLRAILVAQQSLQEGAILEHPAIRAALSELHFAAIWITPPLDLVFDPAAGAGERFDAMLAALARESGYAELADAPVVPLGHAAAAAFPWNFAAWRPERTLAVLSISGQWPEPEDNTTPPPEWSRLDGIPGLVALGEYEWAAERVADGLKQRRAHPKIPLTMLAEPGGGHFDLSDEKAAYLALYLRKAAAYRLPRDGKTGPLRSIDSTRTGWLVDRCRFDEPARVPAGPITDYPEPEDAFWCFDEEHAVATEKFRLDQRGKQPALLGFVQNGAVLPQDANTPQQVTIPFQPTGDGLTFKLRGVFLATVPRGRPERWTGLTEGAAISHPTGGGPIVIERISGPVVKLADDTFAIRFDRTGLRPEDHAAEIWLTATHPGDATFKRSVQQALLRIPLATTDGAAQQIAFEPIPDQRSGVKSIPLRATSNAPVHFYVREGPAEIADDRTLVFTPLPPRTRFPVRVTLVAWQWGRSSEPRLQTAAAVERSFLITR